MQHQVVLIPGDGIGPEICEATQQIIARAGVDIDWVHVDAGLAALDKFGTTLRTEDLDTIARVGVALKGPTTTPVGGGHRSVNVAMRKALGLYANLRMVRSLPGVKTRFQDVDLVVIRENVEDTYGGLEYMQTPDVALGFKFITRPGSEAIARYAFEYARHAGRKRVTCVHKANIHKFSDGLFLQTFQEVAAQYPEIHADDLIVDNACMQLVTRPERFDVLVLPNLYGDIVSDLCAGLIGGLGVAPGANIGPDTAIFEAVHGSAPDIAGQGISNPTAILRSAIHMLRYLGEQLAADRIRKALFDTLEAGETTRDLGGTLNTAQFTEAILQRLQPVPNERTRTPARITPTRQPAPRETERTLVGLDLYVRSEGRPPTPAIPGFTCAGCANRGTAVDQISERVLLVDWWRVRYLADGDCTDADIARLLDALSPQLDWMQLQKLYRYDGKPAYS